MGWFFSLLKSWNGFFPGYVHSKESFLSSSALPRSHIPVQPWEGMKDLVWLRILLDAGRSGCSWLCHGHPFLCHSVGIRQRILERQGTALMHNSLFFKYKKLSNLALTYCRKDFLLFATPGRTRFEPQNTYSFSFMKLPLQIFPSLTAHLQHFDILLQEKAATIT